MLFQLAVQLHQRIGKRPYLVAAEVDRKFVDVNRNATILGPAGVIHENHAYDNSNGKKYYDRYHDQIKEYIDEIQKRFKGDGLLFDLHGAIFQDKRLVVGMLNYDPSDFQRHFRRGHVSVDRLLERFGFDSLYHPYTGFLSNLHHQPLPEGLKTEVLPIDRFQRASPAGGYTVMTYGSNRPGGMNAFHMECGVRMRLQWLERIVEIYADAIEILYRNVIDAPYLIETVFAGKKQLGIKNGSQKTINFEFSLQRTPKKNCPVTILVHTRRVNGAYHPVHLNGASLGFLTPREQVTGFNAGCKTMAQLRKNKNELVIAYDSIDDHADSDLNDFDIVKINVVYCGLG
jgi:hypothetical protein